MEIFIKIYCEKRGKTEKTNKIWGRAAKKKYRSHGEWKPPTLRLIPLLLYSHSFSSLFCFAPTHTSLARSLSFSSSEWIFLFLFNVLLSSIEIHFVMDIFAVCISNSITFKTFIYRKKTFSSYYLIMKKLFSHQ